MKIANDPRAVFGRLAKGALCALAIGLHLPVATAAERPMVEWPYVANSPQITRHSPLDDINATTVSRMVPAWEWVSPDKSMPEYKVVPGAMSATPIMIDNVVYMTTNMNRIVALDAETGKQKWIYDPRAYVGGMPTLAGGFRHKGVAIWRDNGKLRIFSASRNTLICLDAETGLPVKEFGNNGIADAMPGLDPEADPTLVEFNSAPSVYKDLVILGTAGGDRVYGPDPTSAVRAFDAKTGKLVWSFRMIPPPGQFGNETWLRDSWKDNGSTEAWAGFAVDEERGLLYVPGGNPTNNYYGGKRPGAGLFGETLICLDINTGQRKWHYQITHHGLWDYNLPAAPMLGTITKDGKQVDIVTQLTKQGLAFVFDRVTGEPIWPIKETPVPQSTIPGEESWPTQPIPTKPAYLGMLGKTGGVSVDEANDLTPEIKAAALERMKQLDLGPLYTPPTRKGVFAWPGGIVNWGGGAFDTETQRLYVRTSATPQILRLEPYDPKTTRNPFAGINRPDVGYENVGGSTSLPGGIPVTKPPYGGLTAIDMRTGDIMWKIPLGKGSAAIRNSSALKGVTLPDRLGNSGLSGSIVTKGGLVLVGAGNDFFAIDKVSGKEVFSLPLQRQASGTPMTYRAKDGRQYVLLGTGSGDDAALVAFVLPKP
jgi:quinoprotein glucose dehydrogenase